MSLFSFKTVVIEGKKFNLLGKKIVCEVFEDDKQLVRDMLIKHHDTICAKSNVTSAWGSNDWFIKESNDWFTKEWY